MKKIFAALAAFVLFLLLDVAGGVFYHPFHAESRLNGQGATRSFFWDGVLFMLIAWVLLLLFSLTRKKLAVWAPHLTVALTLAAVAGFFLRVGFVTRNW